jgi:hypothetical protein
VTLVADPQSCADKRITVAGLWLLVLVVDMLACGQQAAQQAGWGAAVAISSSGAASDAFAPEVAMDAQGNAIVAWEAWQHNTAGGLTEIGLMAARQTADGAWHEAVVLDTPVGAFVGSQRVAMDAAGNAVALWVRTASFPTVWASTFSPGSGWRPPERLTSAGDQGALPQFQGSFAQVALDPIGNGLAVWQSTRLSFPHDWTIRASRLTEGRWAPAQAIQGPQREIGGSPGVAVSADGTGLAVWNEWHGGVPGIWANRFHPESGWAVAEPINSDVDMLFADVAMDAMGNGMAVSQRYVGSAVHDIVAARYRAGRGWDAPVTATPGRNSVQSLQLAMDPAGNALVIWHEGSPGDVFGVWAVRFAIGTDWGRPVLLQAAVGAVFEPPRIAMDAEGNGTAVWRRIEADRLNVYAPHASTSAAVGARPRSLVRARGRERSSTASALRSWQWARAARR